jgi:hypothetical protein
MLLLPDMFNLPKVMMAVTWLKSDDYVNTFAIRAHSLQD